MVKRIFKYLLSAICAIIFISFIILFIAIPFRADTNRLAPIIQKDERFIVNQLAPRLNNINYQDFVVYQKNGTLQVGRVIGEPGQSLAIQKSELYIDNQRVQDPFIKHLGVTSWSSKMLSEQESDIIAPGHYIVMNQFTRTTTAEPFGTVDKNDIIGTILLRYYPFEKITANFED